MEKVVNHKIFEFTGEGYESNQSEVGNSLTPKIRTNYAGGFRMLKKPAKLDQNQGKNQNFGLQFSENNEINEKKFKNLREEIEELKEKSAQIKRKTKNIKKKFKDDDYQNIYHVEENRHPADIKNLEELEYLKEKNAEKLIEIEAEYHRTKLHEKNAHNQNIPESIPESSGQKNKKKPIENIEKVFEVQQKFKEQFENYLVNKNRKKIINNNIGETSNDFKSENEKKIMLKWIFNKLDSANQGAISVDLLLEELENNSELLLLFGVSQEMKNRIDVPEFFSLLLEKQNLSMKKFLNFEEFFKVSNTKSDTPENSQEINKFIEPCCLLSKSDINLLQDSFKKINLYYNSKLNREELVESMLKSNKIKEILDKNALQLDEKDTLTLRDMLNYIKNDKDVESSQITLDSFLKYFFIQSPPGTEFFSNNKPDNASLISPYIPLLKQIFESLPQNPQQKVSTYDLIEACFQDSELKNFFHRIARKGENSKIPEETIEEVIIRIEEEANSFLTWNEFLDYFSEIGFPSPAEFSFSPKNLSPNNRYEAKMPDFSEKSPFFDSNFEFFQHADQVSNEKPVKSLENQHFSSNFADFLPDHKEIPHTSHIKNTENIIKSVENFKLTVPEPFEFENRDQFKQISIRERKLQEMLDQKRKEEDFHINYRVKPKNVPSEVSNPKYEKILSQHKERSEKNKENSVKRTREIERPFSFYIREQNKVKEVPQKSPIVQFRAKSIPRSSTVPLFFSLVQEKENLRRERIASRAQELLRESSLPPRMKMYAESGSFKKVMVDELPNSQFKAQDPPDFQKLQEKFQKTLEAKKKARKNTQIKPFNIDKREKEIKEKRRISKENKEIKKKFDDEEKAIREKNEKELKKREKSEGKNAENKKKLKFNDKNFEKFSKIFEKSQETNATNTEKKNYPYIQDKLKKNDEKKENPAKNAQSPKSKTQIVMKHNEKNEKIEEKRKEKFDSVAPRLQSIISASIKDFEERGGDLEQKKKEKLQNIKKDQELYQSMIKEMYDKVNKRPLLVETATDTTSKNKTKALVLLQIKRNLEDSGISTVKYFTDEEKILIQQVEENNPPKNKRNT